MDNVHRICRDDQVATLVKALVTPRNSAAYSGTAAQACGLSCAAAWVRFPGAPNRKATIIVLVLPLLRQCLAAAARDHCIRKRQPCSITYMLGSAAGSAAYAAGRAPYLMTSGCYRGARWGGPAVCRC